MRTLLTIVNAILNASGKCDLDYLQNLAQLNPDFAPTIDAFIKWIRSKSQFRLDYRSIEAHSFNKLPDSVMVAQKILALFVEVRILVGQPS